MIVTGETPRNGWKKSSRSNICDNCVEVNLAGDVVLVRDSKDRRAAQLEVAPRSWSAFLRGTKAGEFDRPFPSGSAA
jgi:hypothetical protein